MDERPASSNAVLCPGMRCDCRAYRVRVRFSIHSPSRFVRMLNLCIGIVLIGLILSANLTLKARKKSLRDYTLAIGV